MTNDTKTWAERFPHPGEEPPVPGPCPEKSDHYDEITLRNALSDWDDAAQVRMLYVASIRRHVVAEALDALDRVPTIDLSPEQQIAYVLGVEYLVDLKRSDMFDKGIL